MNYNGYEKYFENRNVTPGIYENYRLPKYIRKVLPADKSSNILDIGCGFGQMLLELEKAGFENLKGVDIGDEAVTYCGDKGLDVIKINCLRDFCRNHDGNKFDFIIAGHLLEHLEKSGIIETLRLIKDRLLQPGGEMLIMVPNAQSNTGCYWAYEDFTHNMLFTTGSIYFVLKSAGFKTVEFLDPDGLEDANPLVKFIKKILLEIYKGKVNFWNRVTGSSFHIQSPQIFTYELKVLAR